MKRTNISLTDEQYEWLKEEGYKHNLSISYLVRDLIQDTIDIIERTPRGKKISETPNDDMAEALKQHVIEDIEKLNPAPKPGKKVDKS